jgi:ornithine cyclodeaminase
MAKVEFRLLTRDQVESLMPPTDVILQCVEDGLIAHGNREVVLPPKSHIQLDDRYNGHFNVLVGWVGPIDMAGVKVVGDYVDNYDHGLPSEVGMLTLYNPRIGVPRAIMDATDITTHRTGAVTGVGAKLLAKPSSKIIGHIGARGTAFANIASLNELFDIEEVRVNSKRPETREKLVEELRTKLGVNAIAVDDAETAVRDADIVIEATRLEKPALLIKDEWLKDDCLLITYGWVMATDPKTVKRASKVIVDDWEQCCKGGQLFPMIESGDLTRESLHGEIGEVAAGKISGREAGDGVIVLWHRGFAISDIMLGSQILSEAEKQNVGQMITLFDRPDE